MAYGLWDKESFNSLGSFPTEEAALVCVLEIVDEHGPDSEEALTLWLRRTHGGPRRGHVADGDELVRRALALRNSKREATKRTGRSPATKAAPRVAA